MMDQNKITKLDGDPEMNGSLAMTDSPIRILPFSRRVRLIPGKTKVSHR